MSFPNLSALSVRERAITLFFLILTIIGGLYAFSDLGRAEDPAFTVRVMVVSAVWPGATPEEIQNQVVDRLEKEIQRVPNLDRVETTIRPGRADMVIVFEDHTHSDRLPALFDDVRKRMRDKERHLPEGVVGPIIDDDFSDVYFGLISLAAPDLPLREVSREAETMRDRLQRVQGVEKAEILGDRPERVFVEFDNDKLANLGISPVAVHEAIRNHNRLGPAGSVRTEGPRIHLRVDTDVADLADLAEVPIRIEQQLIRLGDIARIRQGYQDPPGFMVRAQGEDAVLLGVVMAKGENGLDFGERLMAFVDEERDLLPLGFEMTVLANQAEAIAGSVNLFQVKFLLAVAVVVLVSILAIGLRAGLIVGIAIPLTLALTFLVMQSMGMNLDRITLGALIIALGLLVDDAIIAIEMMIVKMEEGWDRVRAATHAWNVTAAPMLFGTLVTVAGFVPIGFAQSAVGEYAGNIFWVLAISLIMSWVVAVTFTPYLGVKLLPDFPAAGGHGESQLYQTRLYRRLRNIISACVRYRKSVVAMTFGLLALGVMGLAGPVQKQFFPSSDRPEVLVSIYHPQGTAIEATDETSRKVEELLLDVDGIRNVATYVGAGAPRFFISANPEQPNPAFAKLVAVAEDHRVRDRVMASLQEKVDAGAFPEARVRVSHLLYGPPVDWPVTFRVRGEDPDRLREFGEQVREVMKRNPHIRDPHPEWGERTPALHLELDNERLASIGLTPAVVSDQLQMQLDGVPITQLRQDIRSVDLVFRNQRSESVDPANLELRTGTGDKVAVGHLGAVSVKYEHPVIRRYNRDPFLAIYGDVVGAQANDVTLAIWDDLSELRESLPRGYRLEIGGSIEQSEKADASIQKLQPLMVALMLIFIMLQMRSFGGTFIVVATAPLGVIGAVLALLLFQQPFGFVALLGLIGLAGILMRNTLILTQQVADNFSEGMDSRTAVVEAAVQRARPVVLTALAAVLAFVPLTQDSFWGPLAYVLIGGVAVGTLITILFVPALYALWFRIRT